MTVLVDGARLLALVTVALMAGLFFFASTALMPGLARLDPAHGAAAMQVVNRAILNPVFLAVFFASGLLSLAVAVAAPLTGAGGAGWTVLGAALHLVGGIGVTMTANVPLNQSLDAVDPASPEGRDVWAHYGRRWTAWNHVRTAACTAAVAALAL